MFAGTTAPLPEVLKHINYQSLGRLCQTSREYAQMCRNPSTWIFLLKRDFDIDFQDHPRKAVRIYRKIISDASDIKNRALKYKDLWNLRPKFRELNEAIKNRNSRHTHRLVVDIYSVTHPDGHPVTHPDGDPGELFGDFLGVFYDMEYYLMNPENLLHFEIPTSPDEIVDFQKLRTQIYGNMRETYIVLQFMDAWISYMLDKLKYTRMASSLYYLQSLDMGPRWLNNFQWVGGEIHEI